MNGLLLRSSIAALAFTSAGTACAQTEWLEQLDENLTLSSPNGYVRADLSGLLDGEVYYIDQRPPGLLFSDDDFLWSPRLSLFLDTTVGSHLYSLVQVRFDRGFDPGAAPNGDARFDEYLLRYTPLDDARINFQVGKFATVVGNWVQRHDSWQNPFITAPVPYERVVNMTDQNVPGSAAGFIGRRDNVDPKAAWLPILWGPAYTSGASVFGSWDKFDYAVEFKNASVSSRPTAWDAADVQWEHPTWSGRLGYRPDVAWNIGASVSHGTYLLEAAESSPAFPMGDDLSDYNQLTIGTDVSYAWRRLTLWGEAFAARFEVPNVGDADTLAYYLEAKYAFDASWFAALRWNQQFIADVPGTSEEWDRDMWRVDTALGYRLGRHIQSKLQYSYSHQQGPVQQGEQLVAAQVTIKF